MLGAVARFLAPPASHLSITAQPHVGLGDLCAGLHKEMMESDVPRDSSPLGVVSVSEVIPGHQSGRFLMTALAWREGMSSWVMLAQWTEFAGVISAIPPDVVPQSNNLSITVPWEKSPSLGNYFETIKGVLLTPYKQFD